MVQRKHLTAKQQKVKDLVCMGYSIPTVARTLKMPVSSVRSIVINLCNRKAIVKDSATKSPIRYYDPKTEQNELSPRQEKVRVLDYPDVQKGTTPPVIDKVGLFFTKTQPEGTWRWHTKDGIYFTIRAIGTHDKVIDWTGQHVGYWKKPKVANNTEFHSGAIRAFNQEITFVHRHGCKTGKDTFTLYPASIFADKKTINTPEELHPRFIDRALYIASILRNTGWQLTDPTLDVNLVHSADKDNDIRQHYTDGYNPDGADIVADTSDGDELEVEMEHLASDPLGKAKADYMAFLPSRGLKAEADIRNLNERVGNVETLLDRTIELDEKIVTALVKLTETQGTGLEVATKNVEILGVQLQASTIMTKINANILTSIATGNQTTIENFMKKKAEDEKKPSDDYMEAYQ